MLNQVLKKKREAKAAKRRKDFERRRNINHNVPSVRMIEKVPVYRTIPFPRDRHGIITNLKPQVVQIGFKPTSRKVKRPRYHMKGQPSYVYKKDEFDRSVPMIPYPPRKHSPIHLNKKYVIKKRGIFGSKVSKSPSDKRTPSKTSVRGRKAEHERSRLSGGKV